MSQGCCHKIGITLQQVGVQTRLTLLSLQEVEACRAVKRLQISRGDSAADAELQVFSSRMPSTCHNCSQRVLHVAFLQETSIDSWPATCDMVNAAQRLQLLNAESTDKQEPKSSLHAPCQVPVLTRTDSAAYHVYCSAHKPFLLQSWPDPASRAEHTSCNTQKAISTQPSPQRSLSSPDMSKFKFRLTSSKPPVHPISSRTLFRQQSAVLADEVQVTTDSDVLLKKTSDRHSDQERLFHQLDQKLKLQAPQHLPLSPTHSQRSPPFPTSISVFSLNSAQPCGAPASLQAVACLQGQSQASKDVANPSAATASIVPASEDGDGNSSGELCQPSTPIRREDSLPTRDEQQQALAESAFTAMYEQTNMLLRNLHFERLNRRATSA